eukprot:1501019-Amphidinium_carterae.1
MCNLSTKPTATSPGYGAAGPEHTVGKEAWLDRPYGKSRQNCRQLVFHLQLHYCRPNTVLAWLGRPWWQPVARIGEAKNPGPHVCTCNTGGWSRAE